MVVMIICIFGWNNVRDVQNLHIQMDCLDSQMDVTIPRHTDGSQKILDFKAVSLHDQTGCSGSCIDSLND